MSNHHEPDLTTIQPQPVPFTVSCAHGADPIGNRYVLVQIDTVTGSHVLFAPVDFAVTWANMLREAAGALVIPTEPPPGLHLA